MILKCILNQSESNLFSYEVVHPISTGLATTVWRSQRTLICAPYTRNTLPPVECQPVKMVAATSGTSMLEGSELTGTEALMQCVCLPVLSL